MFEPALGRLALVCGLVAPAVTPLSVLGQWLRRCGVDRLVCCFALCGSSVIVGCLRTASGFMAFALVVSVWPVAVFWPLVAPPKSLWRDRSRLSPLSFTAAALACLPGGRCGR